PQAAVETGRAAHLAARRRGHAAVGCLTATPDFAAAPSGLRWRRTSERAASNVGRRVSGGWDSKAARRCNRRALLGPGGGGAVCARREHAGATDTSASRRSRRLASERDG